jgi:hypothetical protein
MLSGTQPNSTGGTEYLQIFSMKDGKYSQKVLSNVCLSTHLIGNDYYGDTLSYCRRMPDQNRVELFLEKLSPMDHTPPQTLAMLDLMKEEFLFFLPINEYYLLCLSRIVSPRHKLRISLLLIYQGGKLLWQEDHSICPGDLVPSRESFRPGSSEMQSQFLRVDERQVEVVSVKVNSASLSRLLAVTQSETEVSRMRTLLYLRSKPQVAHPVEDHNQVAQTPEAGCLPEIEVTNEGNLLLLPSIPPDPAEESTLEAQLGTAGESFIFYLVHFFLETTSEVSQAPSHSPQPPHPTDLHCPTTLPSVSSSVPPPALSFAPPSYFDWGILTEILTVCRNQFEGVARIEKTQFDHIRGFVNRPQIYLIQQSEGKPTSLFGRAIRGVKNIFLESYDVHFLCSVCGKKGSLYTFDCAKKEATKFLRSVVVFLQALQFIFVLGGVPHGRALVSLRKVTQKFLDTASGDHLQSLLEPLRDDPTGTLDSTQARENILQHQATITELLGLVGDPSASKSGLVPVRHDDTVVWACNSSATCEMGVSLEDRKVSV